MSRELRDYRDHFLGKKKKKKVNQVNLRGMLSLPFASSLESNAISVQVSGIDQFKL